ncbi:helix-turn-helix domain-containing protein [Roseomonas sp. CECT 9278]|uniref:helix-turn-helix domain-containing protein n=1 Tax=Roseomonas sp. CECT 9278 TaxID=2845823 RepID=UPI001E4F7867|nr:helix-turn-helix domain-containing protein [Roseomonas sp. CECT 9278]CAH0130310.1 hypothetical protein ROS9278_00221 [Roseomonas sp. CECT 9278]
MKPEGPGGPNGDHRAADGFIRAYRARFPEYHLAWSIFFVSHMSDLRRQMGDLDDALLLAAFGLGPVGQRARFARGQGRSRDARKGQDGPADAATNAQRLADLTGIPRETVRRKLEAFRRRGWVEQAEDRTWRLAFDGSGSALVATDLAEANAALLDRLARLIAEFDRLEREGLG